MKDKWAENKGGCVLSFQIFKRLSSAEEVD